MGIHLLQYNVAKQPPVQDTLLADPATLLADIIALQEPTVRPGTGILQCTRAAGFWPMDGWNGGDSDEELHPWVGFLINKDLDSSKWTASYHSWDLAQLTLETPSGLIQIINIYCEL